MFSVETASSGEPVATIGFEESADGWSLDQVQGKCNRNPGVAMQVVAKHIQKRLTESIQPSGI